MRGTGQLSALAPISWTLPLACLARLDPQGAGDVRPYRLGRIPEHVASYTSEDE